jgi:EAL domain-containing protein (putative c-di-GMP-specific phosphodiesterase class I)
METLAEGVETIDQLSFVLDEGIETIQGFYFSRPIDAENFAKLLESGGRFDSNQLQ